MKREQSIYTYLDSKTAYYLENTEELSALVFLAEAMLAFAAHAEQLSSPHPFVAFGLALPKSFEGAHARYAQLHAFFVDWRRSRSERETVVFRDAVVEKHPPNMASTIESMLHDRLAIPRAPLQPYRRPLRVTKRSSPDDGAQRVRAVEALLDVLDKRVSPTGVIVDESWERRIRDENSWIDEADTVVLLRGKPLSKDELRSLAHCVEVEGGFLPVDYRAFLSRCGGVALVAVEPGEQMPNINATIDDGLLGIPVKHESPDASKMFQLIFFDNRELGFFAFEFADVLRIVDQDSEGGEARIMPYQSFSEWLERYLERGVSAFAYLDDQ